MNELPPVNPEAGFDGLFQQHWQRIYRALLGILGDPDEAEDLALETFWRLHRQLLPGEAAPLNPLGWLYRVATNLGINALRARRRRTQHELEAGQLAWEQEAPLDPARELERTQEQQRVRRVLAGMDARSANMLWLRHSGRSYAEIAAAVQVAPGSVGTLLARAEREFERRYREEDV